ncbi:uncharacterized protein EAE97_010338 [Botrytis byssoidea]|uniref:BTB domain-containing protein n=1 Tax=Botrytis byssoidea TaxID=139641 RepID=A0A9P5LTS9_9HELO|nr:uncharacterized protein EAE97_010338 [Botrytis byssoidea]KAF7926038.1 hypothetical protein EAE97_010338 [Botrytis byssoidea]
MDNNDTPCAPCDDERHLLQQIALEALTGIKPEAPIDPRSSVHAPHCRRASSQEHTSDMSESVSSSNRDDDESMSSSDDTDNLFEKDNQNYGIDTARVGIGSNTVLVIHVRRLREKIPFFAKRFNYRRLNFYEKFVELDPAGYKLLKRWLYGTSIAEQKRDKCRTTELFSLFAIAHTFEQQSLQDEAMDCLAEEIHESRHESRFTPEHVRFAYELTPAVSRLRIFCAEFVAEAIKEYNQFKWNREQVSELLIDIPELLDDVDPEAIWRFEEASIAANNTSDDDYQSTEVDDDIQPVHDEVGGDHTRRNRLLSSSSGSDEHNHDKHTRTELDSSADSSIDSSGKSPDSMSVQVTSPESESGEERRNSKRVKLSHDRD